MKTKVKTKAKTKVKAKAKKKRHYDNSLRANKVILNRQKIIDTYADLLVTNNGVDITLQELAKKTKISLRTLFRFFGDKESLHQELEVYLRKYMSSVGSEIEKLNTSDYAAYSYGVFDQYEKLFKVYLYTNLGQQSRVIFRRKFYELLVAKIIAEVSADHKIDAAKLKGEHLNKIRFVANLINAAIWKDMKDGYGLTGGELAPTVKWAIQTLLKNLNMTL